MDNGSIVMIKLPPIVSEDEVKKWRQHTQENPIDGSGHISLGASLHTLHQNIEAIEEYRTGIALLLQEEQKSTYNSALDLGNFWLGVALQETGRTDEAKAQWTEIVKRYSGVSEAQEYTFFTRAKEKLQNA